MLEDLPGVQEIATAQSAQLYEKLMRMDMTNSNPLQTALADYTAAGICEKRPPSKRKAELRLAARYNYLELLCPPNPK